MVCVVKNGVTLYDTDGNVLHAHGGHMLQQDSYFYWFGENRTGDVRVSCYRSRDLEHWEFRNHVLTYDAKTVWHYVWGDRNLRREISLADGSRKTVGCNIERPKVLYNRMTGKYVMWMHYENGIDYNDARCAVAVCDTIDGDYTYLGSFRPVGNMSRDCTVFIDDDGIAYFISAARDNADLIMYRLSDDYLAIDEQVKILWPGQYREAPALFKRDGRYYMMSSACSGWAPNQGKYAVSDSLTGRWSMLRLLGDETTFQSQPAFVLPLCQDGKTRWIYVGDRWNGEKYHESTYVFYPLEFDADGNMELKDCENLEFAL